MNEVRKAEKWRLPKHRVAIAAVCTLAFMAGVATTYRLMQSPKTTQSESARILMSMINAKASMMRLASPAFEDGGMIPSSYTCDGEDVSPELSFTGVPKEAKSLALIIDDPDAPMGVWDHWIVFNISADVKGIKKGEQPKGVFGKGSGGTLSYMGPCPPSGVHHYIFSLYALDIELPLKEGAAKSKVLDAMEGHILERAQLIGRYGRVTPATG